MLSDLTNRPVLGTYQRRYSYKPVVWLTGLPVNLYAALPEVNRPDLPYYFPFSKVGRERSVCSSSSAPPDFSQRGFHYYHIHNG